MHEKEDLFSEKYLEPYYPASTAFLQDDTNYLRRKP